MRANPALCWLELSLTLLPCGVWGPFLALNELQGAEFGNSITEKISAVDVFQNLTVAMEVYFKDVEISTEVL